MNIQHILVPVDFSEGTQTTLDCARELAGKFAARVTLLHIVQPIFPPVTEVAFTFEKQAREMQDEAERQLRDLAGSLPSGANAETVLDTGVPWDCIVERAGKLGADLIVMGTHGRSGLKHLWLGSVAERVVQHAPCAVLVVRQRPALPTPKA
jgi:universal stress protein A